MDFHGLSPSHWRSRQGQADSPCPHPTPSAHSNLLVESQRKTSWSETSGDFMSLIAFPQGGSVVKGNRMDLRSRRTWRDSQAWHLGSRPSLSVSKLSLQNQGDESFTVYVCRCSRGQAQQMPPTLIHFLVLAHYDKIDPTRQMRPVHNMVPALG